MRCILPASWINLSGTRAAFRMTSARRLLSQPDGAALADHLQQGLRAVPLGTNPALTSAIANDNPLRDIGFAQELYALARPGDVLLGISTSGKAQNVRYAASVAHALEMTVISLTGPEGGPLADAGRYRHPRARDGYAGDPGLAYPALPYPV